MSARLSQMIAIDIRTDAAASAPEAAAEAEREDEAVEFDFRLFSTAGRQQKQQQPPPQKVVLAPRDEDEKHDGPALSRRPVSYYVRGELSAEERARYQLAAVSGGDVVARARQRAWGLEVPWRVTKVVIRSGGNREPGKGGGANIIDGDDDGVRMMGRKRPGKKRRILLRTREKAKKEAAVAAEKQRVTKEEHLKAKKKRLNREKKLKRRQKDKEKKLAAKTEGGGDGGDGEDGGLSEAESEEEASE